MVAEKVAVRAEMVAMVAAPEAAIVVAVARFAARAVAPMEVARAVA